MRLILEGQFDTIYHEHFCYFLLRRWPAFCAGTGGFDVEELPTTGAAACSPHGESRRAVRRASRS